jgi:hypothetical protein
MRRHKYAAHWTLSEDLSIYYMKHVNRQQHYFHFCVMSIYCYTGLVIQTEHYLNIPRHNILPVPKDSIAAHRQ